MKSYKIKQTSPSLWLCSLLLMIFLGIVSLIISVVNQIVMSEFLAITLFFIPFILLAFILPRYIATADVKIIIDEEGIKKIWVKQFFFQKRPNVEIKWTNIKDYIFQPNRQFDKFKINLKNGSNFIFFHNNDNNKDDFLKFITDFKIIVKRTNTTNSFNNNIKVGKTIYETNFGLMLAMISILIMIGIPILLTAYKFQKTPNYAGIAGVYLGAIFYLTQVIIHRVKNKNS